MRIILGFFETRAPQELGNEFCDEVGKVVFDLYSYFEVEGRT